MTCRLSLRHERASRPLYLHSLLCALSFLLKTIQNCHFRIYPFLGRNKFYSSLSGWIVQQFNLALVRLMRRLKKRRSWPSTHKADRASTEACIDADPFAYFVSPVEESDCDAGITSKARSRSLPPSHRAPWPPLTISKNHTSPTARLKQWINRMEKLYSHRAAPPPPEPFIMLAEPRRPSTLPQPGPVIIPRSPPVRGRGNGRKTSGQRITANGRTPTRRPRVWREPSSDIWSVPEESEEVGLGITT